MSTIIDPEFAHSPYAAFTRWLKSVEAQARERCPFLDNHAVTGGTPERAARLGLWGLSEVSPESFFTLAVADRAITKRNRLSLDNPRFNVADDAGAGTIANAKAEHEQRCEIVNLARTEYTALTAAVLASLPHHWRQKYLESPDASRTVAFILLDMQHSYSDMPADVRKTLEDKIMAPFPPEKPIAVALAEFDTLLDSLPAGIRTRYDSARICEIALDKLAPEPVVQAFFTDTVLVQFPTASTRNWTTEVRPLFLSLVDQKRLANRAPTPAPNAFAAAVVAAPKPAPGTRVSPKALPSNAPTQWCTYHGHKVTHSTATCRQLPQEYPKAQFPHLSGDSSSNQARSSCCPIHRSRYTHICTCRHRRRRHHLGGCRRT